MHSYRRNSISVRSRSDDDREQWLRHCEMPVSQTSGSGIFEHTGWKPRASIRTAANLSSPSNIPSQHFDFAGCQKSAGAQPRCRDPLTGTRNSPTPFSHLMQGFYPSAIRKALQGKIQADPRLIVNYIIVCNSLQAINIILARLMFSAYFGITSVSGWRFQPISA